MKIRKVYIKNLNSLKGVHEIDFTVPPLSTAGLFAITGPTGIGKSTILDAICLALYNTVPRFGKNVSRSFIENTGALITRGTRDAIAGVEYECKGALYFSKWSIAFNRNNNLNDYHMELADSGQVVMDLKKSEVPAKNEEIIGLNFDQFIKSMMLAQGEFARFLRSNKDDRGQLLEKITGTGIYRLLGKRAFEKFREKGQQLASLKENIGRVHQEIKPEEERIKLEADLKEREKEFAVLDKQYRNIQKQIEIKDKINALLKRIGEINALQEENNKKIEIFKSVYGERIKKHESLIPFEQKLNELRDLNKHLQTLQKEVENLERQKKELEQKGEAHLLKIQKFVNKKVSDMEALAELEKLELLVMEMDENMKLMAARYKEVWKSTEKNLTVIPLKIGAELTSEDLDIFNNARSIFMERVSTLKNKHKGQDLFSIDNLKKTKVIDIERISSLKKEIQIIAQFEEKLLKQEKIKETLFEESKKLPKTLEKTQAEVEVTEIALRQLEDQKIKDLLISKYELDRENLQAGEPCFLCGSTEHPYSIHAPAKSGNLDTVIEEHKLRLDKLKGLKVGIAQQLERLQFDLKEKSDLIQEYKNEINSHTIEIHSFEKSLKIDLKETDIDSVIEGLQGELEMLEEFERTLRLEEYFETAKVNIDELLSLKKEIISLREKRNNLYTGKDIRNEAGKIREDFRSIKQASIYNGEQLLDKKEKCSVADKEKIQQEDNLIKDLKKVNIRDINEAFSSVLSAVEYQKIQQEERNLLDKKSRWEESVSTLTEELKGYKK
ncbi:MAG: AAA family ATPase, partial [Cyclobacteriaceae bacterium]|nr:AAA family ATPase [Cyclobacteriaceae bacterium]